MSKRRIFKNKWSLLLVLLFTLLLAACSTAATPEATEEETEPPAAEEAEVEEAAEEAEPEVEAVIVEETDDVNSGEDDRPARLRSLTARWNTDWTMRTISYDEILSGGVPRDGIRSIDAPVFQSIEEAEDWLAGTEPVIALEIDGVARAYPLGVLTRHEIANDVVAGVPVAVTFCPLCNSALVFDRRVGGEVYEFGVSGLLRNSDLIMYDRTTESLWQQFTGEGIIGTHAGDQLDFIPAPLVSFDDFIEIYPDGEVLAGVPGVTYGRNPYVGYDSSPQPFLFRDANGVSQIDPRLGGLERVVGVLLNDEAVAYPYDAISEVGAVNDTVGGEDIVVFHRFGTNSALGASEIAASEDVGATGVYFPVVDGEKLTFTVNDDDIVDEQTGSTWSLLGIATSGELEGTELEQVLSTDHFWFSWAAFYPETTIYEGE